MYLDYMKESIKKVEATREKRIKETFPKLKAEEKQELLKNYHPDYKAGTVREIKVGVNKGDLVVNEIADILESYSYLNPENFKYENVDYDVDVLIIGGGGAGVSAALSAFEYTKNILLVTKLRIGDANTIMAQGGIQAADKENDSPAIHYLDVMGGGGYKNIPKLVYTLVNEGPKIIKWLEELGVMFDKKEDGTMITIHGGGTSRKRMHTCKDYTGMEIMRVIRDDFFNKRINYLEFTCAIELLTDEDGKCCGAVLLNLENGKILIVKSKVTILATGGAGRLHVQGFPTSNHYGATADGLVLGYRAGAKFVYLDTIQYHPTGVAFPEQILGQLITEKVRSLGAQLVNCDGEQFIYPLETRDVVASAIIRECIKGKGIKTLSGYGVWLDTPLIEILKGEGTIEKELPAMFRQFLRFGIDIRKEPVLTYPTQHYQNGGILINENCETNVFGLLACGEVSGGVHGRNRLMGNSLLDILVFGKRAGKRAGELLRELPPIKKLTLNHLITYHKELKEIGIDENRKSPKILPDYRKGEFQKKLPFLINL
ncbi:MAG: FAD-binding protein [candidate division WOR-3 bacterium]|nr:FAD-binding protein [candidate division WOR-3 bacterium]MCX7837498.1 FAD-binding protein [candidate division WOR-3 bacterium]MDW8113395.1 FAD-binding protein [candidate division WOR-3 bacterium]